VETGVLKISFMKQILKFAVCILLFVISEYGGGNAVALNSRNKFDIYYIATNSWSVGVLPVNIDGASIISVNNIIYVARVNQVWKLEF